MSDIKDVNVDEVIHLVMNEGSVYLATTDEEYAVKTFRRLELANIRYAEESCGMSEEEAPMTVNFIAGREGDHIYLDEIAEGLSYFNENDTFITSEDDEVTFSDISINFQNPCCDDDVLDFEEM